MELRKIEDGKIEINNYFLETPIGDFLGEFRGSKSDGQFKLFEGRVERPFPYKDYVVLVKKKPSKLLYGQELTMYTRIGGRVYGLSESGDVDQEEVNSHWKLINYDGFVQGYMRDENLVWHNMGGADVEGAAEFQGFEAIGGAELIIEDYEVYSSPYIYIFDVPIDYSAEAVDIEGNVIYEKRHSGDTGMIKLYVDDSRTAAIVLYDDSGSEVTRTELMSLKYGDKFLLSDHNLVLKYKGQVLDHNPTRLRDRVDLVELANLSDINTESRILITVDNQNDDEVYISFDGEDYARELRLPELEPNSQQEIYIKIVRERGVNNPFLMRKFSLEIDEY